MLLLRLLISASQDSVLNNINESARLILDNTKKSFVFDDMTLIAIVAFVISIVSLVVAWRSLVFTKLTVNSIKAEAAHDRLADLNQLYLLKDLIRHLYRNKVVTLAIQRKIGGSFAFYPSEEHLLKLKVLPDDTHFEKYNNNPEKYGKLHELSLLLKNYNTEIDVYANHLRDAGISKEIKKRDLASLNFKPGYLTVRIVEALKELRIADKDFNLPAIPERYYEEMALTLLLDEHKSKKSENAPLEYNSTEMISSLDANDEKNDRYCLLFNSVEDLTLRRLCEERGVSVKEGSSFNTDCYLQILDYDVRVESGRNKKGNEKISMISIKNK